MGVFLVDMSKDGLPNEALGWIGRSTWFPFDPQNGTDGALHRLAIATEQDDRWRTVPGDVSPGRIDHMGQVNRFEKLFNELLAEFPFHE